MAFMVTFIWPTGHAPTCGQWRATKVSFLFTLHFSSLLIVFTKSLRNCLIIFQCYFFNHHFTAALLMQNIQSFFTGMEHRALQISTGLPGPGTVSRGTQTECPLRFITQRSAGVQASAGHSSGEMGPQPQSATQWSVEQGHLIPQMPPMPPMHPPVYPPVPSPHHGPSATLGRAPRESQMDHPSMPGPSPLMHLANMERRLSQPGPPQWAVQPSGVIGAPASHRYIILISFRTI